MNKKYKINGDELVILDEVKGNEFLNEFNKIQKYLSRKTKVLENILDDVFNINIKLIVKPKEEE